MAVTKSLRDILEIDILRSFSLESQKNALRYYFGYMDGKRYKHTDIVKLTGVNRSTTYALPDKAYSLLKIGKHRKEINKVYERFFKMFAELDFISNDSEIEEAVKKDKVISKFLEDSPLTLSGELFNKLFKLPVIFDLKKKMDNKNKFHHGISPTWIWTYIPEVFVRSCILFLNSIITELKSPISLKEYNNFIKKTFFYKTEIKNNLKYYQTNKIASDEKELEKVLTAVMKKIPYLLPDYEIIEENVFLKSWIKYTSSGKKRISPTAKLYLFIYTFRKLGRWVDFEEVVDRTSREFNSYILDGLSKKDFQRRENNRKYFIKQAGKTRNKIWGLKDWEVYGSKVKALNARIKNAEKSVKENLYEKKEEVTRWKTKPNVDNFVDKVLKKVRRKNWKISSAILDKYSSIFRNSKNLKNLTQWKSLAYYVLKLSGKKMYLLDITEISIYLKAYFDKKWNKAGKTPHITILGELTYRDKDGKFIDYGDWCFGLKNWNEQEQPDIICPSCGKIMDSKWKICPYDGTELSEK
ncbi:hypothetical protein KAJ27_24290 [bacterium]|nr:hypothetical protein [bacterium]